ncbi:Pyruvate, phosphate dikinase [Paraconexibacter sp. AEG42_29]|uniref:Pyruvate, phosphate dikinase n=1 Tax=Paraconexibacter sp. AEG42_29 TaxID=2997339 RepID=A0AAU7B397_9ACTN
MSVPVHPSVLPLDGDLNGDRDRLGGKAWGIQRMLGLGVPVPPAFVITTDVCRLYEEAGGRVPDAVTAALPGAMAALEAPTGRTFGGGEAPLLVSVRSGAAVSMPGMMDTILNLGLDDGVQAAIARQTGDPAFADDLQRRFREQYAAVVGEPAPHDPWEQLGGAVAAVLASWNSRRAIAYRADRGLDQDAGTAVTVQAMVFGNLDDASGTGVLFTRNPLTGAREPHGEWLPRGQGEDVVSGTHDPLPLSAFAEQLPTAHAELMQTAALLERDGRDVQDLEFTVEAGRLWLLQSRAAKRSAAAAIRLAVVLEEEGLISPAEALDRVTVEHLTAVRRPHLDPAARAGATLVAEGKPACPGVVSGVIVTDTEAAEDRAADGEAVILARPTTDPEDVPAMLVATGLLTELGGSTSHAAVVSRELGVPCVVGCGAGALMGLEGQVVTIDAAAGLVFAGALPVVQLDGDDADLAKLTGWARDEAGEAAAEEPLERLLGSRRQLV